MPGQIDVYDFGGGGVNLTKDPLELADNELLKSQNAELIRDINTGGKASLSKRGGLTALNGSALSGAITGIIPVPLQSSFVRTLYAALGSATANTWNKTTNGTVWVPTAVPLGATNTANTSSYDTMSTTPYGAARRMATFRTFIVYPGSNYVSDLSTPTNNTPIDMDEFSAGEGFELFKAQAGQSSSDGSYPFTVTDMLVANDTIYFALHDPINAGTLKGRVMSLDMITGEIAQIATGFGSATGLMTGGAPTCMEWYQGKLWVGLSNGNGTANVGKVVWCYPGIDTLWTVDTATLKGYPTTLCAYNGDLYAGLYANASNGATVARRSAGTGSWADSDTTGGGGTNRGYSSAIVYNGNLYVALSFQTAADVQVIRKFDGTTWSTDRDVKANDWGAQTDPPGVGNAVVYNGELYYCFVATSGSAADGFIIRKTAAGSWSRVSVDNYVGRMGVLLDRS